MMIAEPALNVLNGMLAELVGLGFCCSNARTQNPKHEFKLTTLWYPDDDHVSKPWVKPLIWTSIDSRSIRPKGRDAIRLLLVGPKVVGHKIWELHDVKRRFAPTGEFELDKIAHLLRIRAEALVSLAKSCRWCPDHDGGIIPSLLGVGNDEQLEWTCALPECHKRYLVDACLTTFIRKHTDPVFWNSKRKGPELFD